MKKILAFEADEALAQQLAQQFAPYGCALDVVDDGNVGLQKARSSRPDLILLAIELPKMNGFSICNKLKKNPELKAIPLIILSSEATEDTFQQHRKLRTHAEEYLRKPFDFQELIAKVGGLIDLGSASAPGGGMAEDSGEGEISIDTSGLDLAVEDERPSGGPLAGVEADVEAFAESAFAAIQTPDAPAEEQPASFEGFDDERTIAGESPFDMENAGASAQRAPVPRGPLPVPHFRRVESPVPAPVDAEPEELDSDDLEELDIEAMAEPATETAEPPPPEAEPEPEPYDAGASVAAVREPLPVAGPSAEEELLRQENEELLKAKSALEREAERLRGQTQKLEEAKAALESESRAQKAQAGKAQGEAQKAAEDAQALRRDKAMLEKQVAQLKEQVEKASEGGGVSSREFLDLRELLNKKDRELLDLRDAINAKEKALLDQREKITAHARELADRDDKTVALERRAEDLTGKLAAAVDDKDLLARKIDGLEKRIESGQGEVERLRRELDEERDSHKASRQAAEERRAKELAGQKETLETAARKAKDSALEALRKELTTQQESALAAAKKEAEEASGSAEERREGELTEQRLRHEEQLKAREDELRSEKESAIAALEAGHREATEERVRSHSDEAKRLREEHAEALAKSQEAHEREAAELRRIHQRDMGVLGMKLAETENKLSGVLADLEERKGRVDELGAKLSERDERIGALEGAREGLQKKLDEARDTLGARDAEVQALRSRVDQVEAWNSHNQERAIRALKKVQSDQDMIEKARRAMAIALTLLADMPELEDIGPATDSSDGTLRT